MAISIFVYSVVIILILITSAMSRYASYNLTHRQSNVPWLSIIIFSLVFGVRYNVGIDQLAYIEMYQAYRMANIIPDTEAGFFQIIKFFADLGCHYSVFFTFLAFLQMSLIFISIKDYPKQHSFIIITFFLLTTFLNFMNGIRQEIAFCFWALAVYFMSQKKFIPYVISILLGTSCHLSAIILLPFYFIYSIKDSFFNNVKLQIVLLALAIIAYNTFNMVSLIFDNVIQVASLMGYYGYFGMVSEGNTDFIEPSRNIGLGYYIILLLNIIIVLYSKKVKSYYNNRQYNILYDLYYFGVLFLYLANGSIALQRINYYFYNFNFIVGAFTLYYLYKEKNIKHTLVLCLMLLCYFLIFSAIVIYRGGESCAIYNTIWNI